MKSATEMSTPRPPIDCLCCESLGETPAAAVGNPCSSHLAKGEQPRPPADSWSAAQGRKRTCPQTATLRHASARTRPSSRRTGLLYCPRRRVASRRGGQLGMGSRRLRWVAGGGVLVCAAALAVGVACRSGGEEQRPPGEPPPPPLTAAALAPVFGTLGPEGVVPQRLVVELARPIAEQGAGEAKAGATRLVLEPDVDGELTRTGPSTLAFVPDEPFAPGTTYQVTLVQVQTSDGKTLAAPSDASERGGWRHRFTTPRFQLARLALAGFEPNARWADVDLVFSAAVDPDT